MFSTPQATIIKYVVIFCLFFGLGFATAWKIQSGALTQIKLDAERDQRIALEKQANDYKKQVTELSANSESIQKKFEELRDENERIRNDINTNSRRVYVRAVCPSRDDKATIPDRVETRSPELTPDARQDYLSLRAAIIQVTSMLELCKKDLLLFTE